MKKRWRLLDTGHLTAAENMALDRVLLECKSEGLSPDTLRFLQFRPHSVLVGRHQSVALEVEEDYCRRRGIDICRRITGGGNLYWDESQIGWEIFTDRRGGGMPRRPEELYEKICQCCVAGLARLGVEARYRPKNDIEVAGRKISGTGGKAYGGAFLYQGSLLTDFDVDTMVKALRLPVSKLDDKAVSSFRRRVVSLKELLPETLPAAEIKAALTAGFAESLGVAFELGGLLPEEERRFRALLPHFRSRRWIYGRHDGQRNDLFVHDHKCRGGLIRVSLRLDGPRELIKSACITGDFFLEPERAVLDLEAALKNTSSRPERIRGNILAFFKRASFDAPYLTPEDFAAAVIAAAKRQKEGEHHADEREV